MPAKSSTAAFTSAKVVPTRTPRALPNAALRMSMATTVPPAEYTRVSPSRSVGE